MRGKHYVYAGAVGLAVAAALSLSVSVTQADTKREHKAPRFTVDASWPKMPLPSAGDYGTPLVLSTSTGKPKPWSTGEVAGTCIDSRDHVFIVTRGNLVNSPETLDSVPAAPVIEFDPDGNVVNAWGNRNVLPNGIHGCFVDYQDNVWIAGNGDGIVQKYSHDGSRLLLQIGTRGVCDNPPANACGNSGANPAANQSKTLLNQPANMYIDPNRDPMTGERGSIYIADGYGNHRVVVFSADGTWLRQWGGVAGTVNFPLTDSPGLFASGDGGHPHCITIGNDGLVYVCDRADDRIQVFTKTGVLQRIIAVVPGTGVTLGIGGTPGLGTAGSAWDLVFSNDFMQTFMIEADGGNEIVHIMSRVLGTILSEFGAPGLQAGQFTFLHSVALDSKGNLYTGETINGRRIQKFTRVECSNGKGKGNDNCDD
jgi:NHL repeat-containing protein